MTYRKLQEWLGKLDNEQLDSDVTFYDSDMDEFFAMSGFIGNWSDFPEMGELAKGTFDYNHPFFQL